MASEGQLHLQARAEDTFGRLRQPVIISLARFTLMLSASERARL